MTLFRIIQLYSASTLVMQKTIIVFLSIDRPAYMLFMRANVKQQFLSLCVSY